MVEVSIHVVIPYGRKFLREPIFAVFAVDWRSMKIKIREIHVKGLNARAITGGVAIVVPAAAQLD